MPSVTIAGYEIEYSAMRSPVCKNWRAYLSIYVPSDNPQHRNNVFPHKWVSVDQTFPNQEAAEQEALRVGRKMVEKS